MLSTVCADQLDSSSYQTMIVNQQQYDTTLQSAEGTTTDGMMLTSAAQDQADHHNLLPMISSGQETVTHDDLMNL